INRALEKTVPRVARRRYGFMGASYMIGFGDSIAKFVRCSFLLMKILFPNLCRLEIMKTMLLPLCLVLGIPIHAADELAPATKSTSQVALTVETAGQDYADQGEYTNDWGGAQIIALGEHQFRVVIHRGGLPGAGWDKSPKTEIEGRRIGAAIVFTNASNGWTYSAA